MSVSVFSRKLWTPDSHQASLGAHIPWMKLCVVQLTVDSIPNLPKQRQALVLRQRRHGYCGTSYINLLQGFLNFETNNDKHVDDLWIWKYDFF